VSDRHCRALVTALRIGKGKTGDATGTMSDDNRTVFVPAGATPATPPAPPPEPVSQPPTSQPPVSHQMAPRAEAGRIQPGDLLNHIFEVRRFLARGGMGEVFEGVNVTSDERVAIKVMLPALAADPNVQTMFRREARTLTRLAHPALVQYRVLAQEPQLGVLYIVTEFIDGGNLCDVLDELKPDEATLTALLRRLASGLQAAHGLGAIHRDISPDNVLLENGELARAKIIDFGIAKDLDPGSKTIIGDGFAGKLSYVAPEQLGDFSREIGPWTDVYSLALVILAIAGGKGVDLGGSFVDAVDKRRKGIPLDAAPAGLRPVLGAMLAPDPAERLRSMDAVLAMLAGTPAAASAPPASPKPVKAPKPVREPAATGGTSKKPLILAGAAGALLLAGGSAWFATRGGGEAAPATTAATAPVTPQGNPAERARAAVTAALPGIGCSWLELVGAPGASAMTLRLSGVAGRPAEAQAAIARAAASSGARLDAADFSDVAPITASECGSVDAFRAIRATGATRLSVPQRTFETVKLPAQSSYPGQLGAHTIINLDLSGGKEFALYGLEPSGEISAIISNRKEFDAIPKTGDPIADLGKGRYRFTIDVNHLGWSGILLLTGTGGFSDKLVAGPAGSRGADWAQRFAAAAKAGNWRSEMVWFKMVDEVPN
jgi:serine/threonine-protein kinase